MLIGFAVMLALLFAGWLGFWLLSGRPIKTHAVMYLLSALTGIYTIAFFLSMEINVIIKVIASIILGVILIFVATSLQRRLASRQR